MVRANAGGVSPDSEQKRLEALYRFGILGPDPEPSLDRVTRLAAAVMGAPIALLSFEDKDRHWFKSRFGTSMTETPRDTSFCHHAMLGKTCFTVEDTHLDERFAQNPIVTGAPFVRTYAGAPIITPNGDALGTLCVLFDKVTPLGDQQLSALTDLAQLVVEELNLREMARDSLAAHTAQRDALSAARQSEAFLESVAGVAGVP